MCHHGSQFLRKSLGFMLDQDSTHNLFSSSSKDDSSGWEKRSEQRAEEGVSKTSLLEKSPHIQINPTEPTSHTNGQSYLAFQGSEPSRRIHAGIL